MCVRASAAPRSASQRLTPPLLSPSPPQVATEFSFDLETVAIALNYFDRVLSKVNLAADVFQTAAFACIFIGAARARHAKHARAARPALTPAPPRARRPQPPSSTKSSRSL